MRAFIFERDGNIIGIIGAPEGITLTDDHMRRIGLKGIKLIVRYITIPKHDGDVNRLVDTLIERGWL